MSRFTEKFLIEFQNEKNEEKRFSILMEFINYYYDGQTEAINKILRVELDKNIKENNIDGEGLIRFMFAYSAFENGDNQKGEEELKRVMEIFDRIKNHEIRAQIFNFLAFMHSHQGNFDKAFEYCYQSIKEAELSGNKKNQFWGAYSMGVFYFDLKDLNNSLKCFNEAHEGFTRYGNPYGVARCENGIASVYIKQEKFKDAEIILNRSLNYYKDVEAITGQSRCLNDLGLIFRLTGKNKEALNCFKESLEIRRQSNHSQGIATSLNEIADVLIELKAFNEAEKHLDEARTVCEKIHNRGKLFRTHLLYSMLYRHTNEPWKALEHLDLYEKIKSEVLNETANNKIKEMEKRMATEKSEKEAEIERLKNVELKAAYSIIEEKQKEIIDSIQYAKRIQLSLMPSEKYIGKYLND